MPLKSRTTWESPQKLFPPDNPVAALVATLCILREDLYLEYAGMAAVEVLSTSTPDLPIGLDDNGADYRRTYFFRGSLRTLAEIQVTLHALNSRAEFRKMLETRPIIKDQTLAFLKTLNQNLKDLRKVRNNLGGHVLPTGVQDMLEDPRYVGEVGKFDNGKTLGETHYGFAHNLCVGVMLLGAPHGKERDYINKMLDLNQSSLPVINNILLLFLESQGYFRRR